MHVTSPINGLHVSQNLDMQAFTIIFGIQYMEINLCANNSFFNGNMAPVDTGISSVLVTDTNFVLVLVLCTNTVYNGLFLYIFSLIIIYYLLDIFELPY